MRFGTQLLTLLSLAFSLASYAETDFLLRGTWALKENTQSFQDFGQNHQRFEDDGSLGRALTISAGRNISEHCSITAEWQVNSGSQQNLRFFQDNERFTEHLFQLAFTVTFLLSDFSLIKLFAGLIDLHSIFVSKVNA